MLFYLDSGKPFFQCFYKSLSRIFRVREDAFPIVEIHQSLCRCGARGVALNDGGTKEDSIFVHKRNNMIEHD